MFRRFGETYCYRRICFHLIISAAISTNSAARNMNAVLSSCTLLRKIGPFDHYMMYKSQKRPSFDKKSAMKNWNLYVGCFSITAHAFPAIYG